MATVITPWSQLLPFITGTANASPTSTSGLPGWVVDDYNKQRIGSYDFFDSLYDNTPDQFRLTLRGDEESPIYVPSAKRIINTLSRYVARDMGFSVESTNPTEQTDCIIAFGDFFKRERFFSKFNAAKKAGLRRGDFVFYVYADPDKPAGTRVSIKAIHPRNYWPRVNDEGIVVGADMIENILLAGKPYIKRQRYLTWRDETHPSFGNPLAPVTYESLILEVTNWQDEIKKKVVQAEVPQLDLPTPITTLPFYHVRFNEQDDEPFGESFLMGMERLFLAINQTITDEELALAMAGLGMYKSDSSPVDDDGNAVDWILGPKRVVEVPQGGIFERVTGVQSVQPSQDHIKYLTQQAEGTLGISDVALGQVDTAVAQSGIALALRMGPLLDTADEADLVIKDVINQLFFDLKSWFSAYEALNFPTALIECEMGEKLPLDKDAEWKNFYAMWMDGAITLDVLIKKGEDLFGWEFPADMVATIEANQQAAAGAAAQADAFASRLQNPDGTPITPPPGPSGP